MTIEAAIVLGALQGLTEFLPVSSDGHLALGAMLLGITDMPLSMVVALHAGTLVATAVVLRAELWELGRATGKGLGTPRALLGSDRGRELLGLVAASVPTAVIGLLLKEHVERWSHQPFVVGACLLASAALVATTVKSTGTQPVLALGPAFVVGIAQGAAVLPGLSRSAATLAIGMLLGLRPADAFRFSFLLSLPAVGGALCLKLSEPGAAAVIGVSGLVGAIVAFATGIAALLLLRRMLGAGQLWMFALYLVPLGLGAIGWGLWGNA